MKTVKILATAVLTVLTITGPVFAQSTNYTWIGPQGGEWFDGANWSNITAGTSGTVPPKNNTTDIYVGVATNAAVQNTSTTDQGTGTYPDLFIGYSNAGYVAVFTNDGTANGQDMRFQTINLGANDVGSHGELVVNQGKVWNYGQFHIGKATDSTGIVTVNGKNGIELESDTFVGSGENSYGEITVNSGGLMTQDSGSDDTVIGSGVGSTGIVTVASGGTFEFQHGNGDLRIAQGEDTYGRLTIDPGAIQVGNFRRDEIRVGNGLNSVGILDAANRTLQVDNSFYIGNGTDSSATLIASNLQLIANGGIRLAQGNGSVSTVTLDDRDIYLNAGKTNAVFIGIGTDSELNITGGDLNFIDNGGVLAGFGVGKTGSNYVDLINQFDSSGYITANMDIDINDKDHLIKALQLGIRENAQAVLTVSGSATLNPTLGGLGVDMSLGTGGANSSGSFSNDTITAARADGLYIGTGGANSYGYLNLQNAALTNDDVTAIANKLNSTGIVNVASYVKNGGNRYNRDVNIGDGTDSYGMLTAANGSIEANILRVGDAVDAYGMLDMGDGSITLDNNMYVGNGNTAMGYVHAGQIFRSQLNRVLYLGSGANSYGELVVSNAALNASDVRIGGNGAGSGGKLIIESGTMTNNGWVQIATGAGSSAYVDAPMWIMNGGDISIGTGADSVTAVTNKEFGSNIGNIVIGSGANSKSILRLTGSTAVNLSTNTFSIGAGGNSMVTHNIGPVSGVIGNFAVGAGSTTADKALINQLDSVGTITANTALLISNKTHTVKALSVATSDGSVGTLTLNPATGTFIYDNAMTVTVASGNNATGGLAVTGGLTLGNTNQVSIGMGLNSSVLAIPTINTGGKPLGKLLIGSGADNAIGQGLLAMDTTGAISLNSSGRQLLSGTHDISNMNIGDIKNGAVGSYTNTATSQPLVIKSNLRLAYSDNSTGTFFMAGGTLDVGKDNTGNEDNIKIGTDLQSGYGRFDQTGGVVTVARNVQVGVNGNETEHAEGDLNLSGGVMTITNNLILADGNYSEGRATFTGGVLTNRNVLLVGAGNDAVGTMTIEGAGKVVTKHLEVGADGNDVSGTLYITNGGSLVVDSWNDASGDLRIGAGDFRATGYAYFSNANVTIEDELQFANADDPTGATPPRTHNTGTLVAVDSTITIVDQILMGPNLRHYSRSEADFLGGTLNIGTNYDDNLTISYQGGDTTGQWSRLNIDVDTLATKLDSINVCDSRQSYGELTVTNPANELVFDSYLRVGTGNTSTGVVHIANINRIAGYAQGDMNIGLGANSRATLTVDGGTVHQMDVVVIGTGSGSEAAVHFNDLVITNTDNITIGANTGMGVLNMTNVNWTRNGTTSNPDKAMRVGNNSGVGTLNMVGGLFKNRLDDGDLLIGEGTASTGTVNLSGGAEIQLAGSFEVGSGNETVGTANIGNATLNVDVVNVANASLTDKGTLNIMSGALLNVGRKTGGNGYFNVGGDGTVNMSDGTINMLDTSSANFRVGQSGTGAGVFNLSGGTVNATNQEAQVGSGNDDTGILNISGGTFNTGTKTLNIGSASNSVGYVNVYGGTLVANRVDVGGNGLGVGSQGFFTVTGGVVNVASAFNVGEDGAGQLVISGGSMTVGSLALAKNAGSSGVATLTGGSLLVNGTITSGNPTNGYINVTGNGSLTWNGRVEADFIGLWDAGILRRDGQSGLTGATFSDYLSVAGDVLTPSSLVPVGDVALGGPITIAGGRGMTIVWDSTAGQTYDVEYRNDLITEAWQAYTNVLGVYTNMAGTGGSITITAVVEEVTQSYRVTTEP